MFPMFRCSPTEIIIFFQENLSDQNDDALLNSPWVKTGMMQVLAVLPAVWHFISILIYKYTSDYD